MAEISSLDAELRSEELLVLESVLSPEEFQKIDQHSGVIEIYSSFEKGVELIHVESLEKLEDLKAWVQSEAPDEVHNHHSCHLVLPFSDHCFTLTLKEMCFFSVFLGKIQVIGGKISGQSYHNITFTADHHQIFTAWKIPFPRTATCLAIELLDSSTSGAWDLLFQVQ